jgi:hypothetical protein
MVYWLRQAWYHVGVRGNSPDHLADLQRMLQFTVDNQPPRPDGAATGWIQGSRIVSWQAALQKGLWAPREHLVDRGAKWTTKLVEGLHSPALHAPCQPPPPPPPIRLS